MRKVMQFIECLLAAVPAVVALLLSAGTVYVSMKEDLGEGQVPTPVPLEMPEIPRFWDFQERPDPHTGRPDVDDRTPLEHLSNAFGLADPQMADKLSGVGGVHWAGVGAATGTLFGRPDVVLTTAHLFVKGGRWKDGGRPVSVPPPATRGFFYLDVCQRSYRFSLIEVGSEAPRQNLGLDYALVQLEEPACPEAAVLQGATLSDERMSAMVEQKAMVLNLGVYRTQDVDVFRDDPVIIGKARRKRPA